MQVMRLLLLVLLDVGSSSEVCESQGASGRGAALLQQRSIKELFYISPPLWQEQEDEQENEQVLRRVAPQDLLQRSRDEGLISHLPCGVEMKLNASFSLDASCPAACPLLADPTSKAEKEFCISKCVLPVECALINPEAPVPDQDLGSCRGPVVAGCEEHSMDGTDTCLQCGAFRTLHNGKCYLKYAKTIYAALIILALVVLLLLWILVDLMTRPVTNEANLEDALNYRSKQKFRMPDSDGTGRHMYPISTNLCSTIIGGPGLALHFRFQAVLICWAALVGTSWVLLALMTDHDLLVLGTKEFGTAFRNCVLVAWGRSTQQRLMYVKESFIILVYIFSFVGSILFGIQQLRFYQDLDEQNDTMKDYAVQISNLPSLDGSERLEEELKECLETATSHSVVGVSICWAYREHKDTIHVEMMKSLHQGQRGTHFQAVEDEDMGPFRRRLFEIEKVILSEGEENNVSEAELKELVQSFRSSSMAFAVFETEQARDEAVHLLSNGLVFRDHAVRVSTPTVEPHGVHWNNIDGTGFNGKLWRLSKGFLYIVTCLLLWMLIFYAPYAWSILEFNYEAGRQPGIIYTLVFSLIVCVGNLLMAEICSRVADAIGFEFKDTRENCYMVLYLVAIALNVGLDLWTTYFMATQIMVGMDFRTVDGTLLADVNSFVKKFESYALQRSMGQQLIEYAFPCTFIVPFLAEPCAVIFLFSRIFMLLIGCHPELKIWECRNWLAGIDMDLGRYADCLVNVYLATMVFLFPGGYTHWIFFYLTMSHIYIYVYDHYRVLRVVPRATFSSRSIDFCAQALLAPACGMLLVALIVKGNCMTSPSQICLDEAALLSTCFFAFTAHCVIHIFILSFFVPLFGVKEKIYRKDAKTYSEVAASEPCSWFSANPIHCLRSKLVFKDSPPCTYFMAGLESKMEVNEKIGCFFKEKAAVVEDASSYYMPQWRDVNSFLRRSTFLLSDPADDDSPGDTGATQSG